MTICNVCTLNLRQADFMLKGDDALLARVNTNLEAVGVPPYSGGVEVKHFLWLVADGEGFELLKASAHKGLKGIKIAPFYGCQILRPSKLLGFENPDEPWSLERIIEACGGEVVDYPAKIKCCGFPIIQAREDTALGELVQPIEQAIERGADAIVTPCPLCHLSLDAWQSKLNAQRTKEGLDPLKPMPILHLAQLIGVAAGLEDSELKFRRHVVSMKPVLDKLAVLVSASLASLRHLARWRGGFGLGFGRARAISKVSGCSRASSAAWAPRPRRCSAGAGSRPAGCGSGRST